MAKKTTEVSKIKVTLIKSYFNCDKKQQAVLDSLGLRKIRQEKIHNDNACIQGMIAKVPHVLKVEKA